MWPAFWMLADDGGWPPEIDVMEGRGAAAGRPRDDDALADSVDPEDPVLRLRLPAGGASNDFHNYGMLWTQDRLVYFIDRKPVSEIKVPIGFDDPMYMIVNLAMGSKWFGGVGVIDGKSPQMVEFQIDRISVYQIDPS